MITLTESAIKHIQNMLKNKPKNAAFRLSIKKTGCSGYRHVPEIVTEKKESDIEIPIADFFVYLDKQSSSLIQNTVIDYVKKSLGVSQLEFKNPNADNVCGCGESFNVKKSFVDNIEKNKC